MTDILQAQTVSVFWNTSFSEIATPERTTTLNPAIIAKRRKLAAERFLARPMAAFLAAQDARDGAAMVAAGEAVAEALADYERYIDTLNYHPIQNRNGVSVASPIQ